MRIIAVSEAQFEALFRLSSPIFRNNIGITARNLYDYPHDTLYIVGLDVTVGSIENAIDMNGTPYTWRLLNELGDKCLTERMKVVTCG